MMLADGIASRASDVHIEPVEGGVVVRYRIDGVLRQVMKIPRSRACRSSRASRSCRASTSPTAAGRRTAARAWR
jgi:type II secretory ATPase GspE/PulE/Tfp pilus assembly ATPase PilB-like protein